MILAKKDVFRQSPAPKKPVGVVEAAGSNPVTQTRLNGRWKISRFSFIIKLFPHFSGADFLLFLLLKMRRKMIENEVGT